MRTINAVYTLLSILSFISICDASDPAESLIFHASFDKSADADLAHGTAQIFTAESLKRQHVQPGLHEGVQWQPRGGHKGGALHFKAKSDKLVFFQGGKNVPYSKQDFQGTVSMWMRLNPVKDLPDGFVDPLQITDKKWNDASFFVDFDQGKARDFRLGVFSNYGFWNSADRKWEDLSAKERPLVTVKKPPFARDRWTHVAFSWKGFNSDQAKHAQAVLYLNGTSHGTINGRQLYRWDPDKVVIMLGINYVGWIDDLAIFNRALTAKEIKRIGAE